MSDLFYAIFFSENTVMHFVPVPDTLQIQSRTSSTLLQSQSSKSLLSVIAHKRFMNCNPFIFISLYKIKKQCLFLILHTIYWTSDSGCSKKTLGCFTDFQVFILKNYSCNKRKQNIPTGFNKNLRIQSHTHTHTLAALVPIWTLIFKIIWTLFKRFCDIAFGWNVYIRTLFERFCDIAFEWDFEALC